MSGSIFDCITLYNGVKMPILGFGSVFITNPKTIVWAIEHGFRSIDTATDYDNEDIVGKAVRTCGLPREELFVTTKVWNSSHGYDKTIKAFKTSLKTMGLDHIDLYLIHWPCPNHGLYIDTWRAMEHLYKEGLVRAIGVSNFYEELLEQIKEECEMIPMVNQVEYNPYHQHTQLRRYCQQNNIQIEAYTPIARGLVNDDPVIQNIAAKHHKTCVQITIRFLYQENICLIPRSSSETRILENSDIFDFELSSDEVEIMRGLNEERNICGEDPRTFHELKNLKDQITCKK